MLIDSAADAHQAGMTQREIAAALGRSQPEVSRLLSLSEPRFHPRSTRGMKLVECRAELLAALRSRGARNIRVFGSVARGDDTEDSDIDLLVDIPDDFSLLDLGSLSRAAEQILGEKVDVVPARGLTGGMRSSALADVVSL